MGKREVWTRLFLGHQKHWKHLLPPFATCPPSLRVFVECITLMWIVNCGRCLSVCAHGCLKVCLQMKVDNVVFPINGSITKPLLPLLFDILSSCLLHVSLSCTGKSFILTHISQICHCHSLFQGNSRVGKFKQTDALTWALMDVLQDFCGPCHHCGWRESVRASTRRDVSLCAEQCASAVQP